MLKISPSCHWGNHGTEGEFLLLTGIVLKYSNQIGVESRNCRKWSINHEHPQPRNGISLGHMGYNLDGSWASCTSWYIIWPMMEIAINILVGLTMAAGLAFKGRFPKRIWMWMLCEIASLAVRSMKNNHAIYILLWYMNMKHMHLEYIWFTWYMGCTYDPKSTRTNTWLQ